MTLSREPDRDSRTLLWDGCLNVRDLGGLRTAGAGHTKWGEILRADSIRKLTDAGWEALLDYGVGRIVDLRVHSELADDPPRDVAIDVVHLSVLPEFQDEMWVEIDAIGDAQPDAVTETRAVYLEFLERFPRNFAAAVEAIATAPEGGVVIHCVGGKDRTGLVSALVLRLVGVPIADVAADYALSEDNLRPERSEWIDQASTEEERRRRERRSETPAAAMVGVLEELDRRYGSVERYLLAAGASPQTLQRIRDRLTPES
jgi:protein tyrosine/serine phosphatase